MKQLGDEMKLPETCTFSLKFQTVETQESLITHGIRANESFAFSSYEFWEFSCRCKARKKQEKEKNQRLLLFYKAIKFSLEYDAININLKKNITRNGKINDANDRYYYYYYYNIILKKINYIYIWY